MKIVMLTRYTRCQIHAVNKIHDAFGLDAVVFEGQPLVSDTGKPSKLKSWWWQHHQTLRSPKKCLTAIEDTIRELAFPCKSHHSIFESGKQAVCERLFDSVFDRVEDETLSQIWMGLKDFDVEKIKAMQPDVLLVYGTSILPQEIIDIPKVACLNLHWGLSPYYKGTHCTDWAILNDELEKIGVTVHLLDAGIDSGPIVSQARPSLERDDCPFSIDMKLSLLGTDLMIKSIQSLISGNTLVVKEQDASVGKTYYGKDWNALDKRLLSEKLTRGMLGDLLDAHQQKIAQVYEGQVVEGSGVYQIQGSFPPFAKAG